MKMSAKWCPQSSLCGRDKNCTPFATVGKERFPQGRAAQLWIRNPMKNKYLLDRLNFLIGSAIARYVLPVTMG